MRNLFFYIEKKIAKSFDMEFLNSYIEKTNYVNHKKQLSKQKSFDMKNNFCHIEKVHFEK